MDKDKIGISDILSNAGMIYFSSGVGAAAVFPLDTIRVRLQSQQASTRYSAFQEIKRLVNKEGLFAFYKGITPKIITTGLEKTVKITTFNHTTSYMVHNYGYKETSADIVAGIVAGGVQSLVISPSENLSTKMQINRTTRYISIGEAYRQIGIRGLYNGWLFCFLRDAPFSAIYFPTMNYILRYLANTYPDMSASTQSLIAGSVAAVPSAFLVTPFDVIKTRIQASGNTNYIKHIKSIYTQSNIRGFYKGGLFRIARSTPQFGITMATLAFINNLNVISS
jgi:solute carrier family 25 aspartate/glutamate transporter 12/13